MNILSLSSIPLLPHFGSGKTRLHWTNGLRNLGHTVDVLQPEDFELGKKFKIARRYRFALGILLKVRKIVSQKQYDIIEFYGDEYWLLLLWLKKIKQTSITLVAHVDGIELYDMDKRDRFLNNIPFSRRVVNHLNKKLATITFTLADKFICGCEDELNYVFIKKLFTPKNAKCISPGIEDNFHEIQFVESKNETIVFFGSWIDRKGIKVIPEVISTILKKNPGYRFEVIGSWFATGEIMEQFDKEFHSQITVHSKLPIGEVINHLLSSSIFFFPTYSEGFGLATLEAMSCSVAVVTTRTGIGANLSNNVNARICDFDNVEEMVAAINDLINNQALRKRISQNGYFFAKNFVWHKQIQKLEQQYLGWINNPVTAGD